MIDKRVRNGEFNMRYELWFLIRGKKDKLLSRYETEDDAWFGMLKQIDEHSSLYKTNKDCPYFRTHRNENSLIIDYGAHNALYIIKKNEKGL